MGSGEIVVEKKLRGLLVCLLAWCSLFCLCPPAPRPLGREKGKRTKASKRVDAFDFFLWVC